MSAIEKVQTLLPAYIKETLLRQLWEPEQKLYALTKAALSSLPTKNPYEGALFDDLFDDLKELLDSCIANARTAAVFSSRGLQDAIEFVTATSALDSSDALANLGAALVEASTPIAVNSAKEASEKYAVAAGDALAAGFAAQSFGTALASAVVLDAAGRAADVQLRSKRVAIERGYICAAALRRGAVGAALNFADRADRLYKVLSEDIRECYTKALAVKTGAEAVLGKDLPTLPDPMAEEILSALYVWVAEVGRILDSEAALSTDVTYDIRPDAEWGTGKAHGYSGNWGLLPAMNQRYTLDAAYFGDTRSLRVRGIGVGTVNEHVGSNRLVVTLPLQIREGQKYSRPAWHTTVSSIGDVSGPPIMSPSACINASPVGEWNLKCFIDSTRGRQKFTPWVRIVVRSARFGM